MSNVKNFGLIGVGSELQFSKAGSKVTTSGGNFSLRNAGNSADVALTLSELTASTGNITATAGNITATAGNLVLNDATLQRQAAGVLQAAGTGAFILPVGNDAERNALAQATGMIRVNDEVPSASVVEFYNGTTWVPVGDSSVLEGKVDAIIDSLGAGVDSDGEFDVLGFPTVAALDTPTSFTDAINQIASYASGHDTLEEIIDPVAAGNIIYAVDEDTWGVALPGSTSGVQPYDAELTAIAAIDASEFPGYVVLTGAGTAVSRAIEGNAGRIVVTNGDGVDSDTSIDLDTVTNPGNSGSFVKITTDTYGRVTNSVAVAAGDITALVDSAYVNVTGDTMSGDLVMGTNYVTMNNAPVSATQAANKAYVDSVAAGLTWKTAVLAATVAANITLENEQTVDGIALVAGNRVLVKNQTLPEENGIYIVVDGGPWTRSTDADSPAELDSATVFVQQGTANADTGWTQTTTIVTVGTTPQNWVQFSGSSTYSWGEGLGVTGNTVFVNMGAGITSLPGDEVGIHLLDPTTSALILTANGTDRSSATGDMLHLLLAGSGGLSQGAGGLTISAAGVTNAMLVNSGFTTNADTETGTLALGGELEIQGNSTQGIVTSVSPGGSIFAITASNASSSQKGVASFTATEFVVTSGNVALGTVANSNLANSTITFTGDTGSEAVALGESFDFNGDSTFITTAVSGNVVSLTLGTVDVAHGGTGLTTIAEGQVLIGGAANTIAQDADFEFDTATNTLTVGTATIQGEAAGDVIITATATDGNIQLVPDGAGAVIIGPSGSGEIASEAGQALSITGSTVLTLASLDGDIVLSLADNTTDKVTVSGPSAEDYATGLADENLVNKYYVDQAVSSATVAGDVISVMATVALTSATSVNIGSALPVGATVLSVKVNVTAASDAATTVVVGKSGGNQYMTADENDPETTGLYLAECMVTEGASEQVQATVATPGSVGSATIVVTYRTA